MKKIILAAVAAAALLSVGCSPKVAPAASAETEKIVTYDITFDLDDEIPGTQV